MTGVGLKQVTMTRVGLKQRRRTEVPMIRVGLKQRRRSR